MPLGVRLDTQHVCSVIYKLRPDQITLRLNKALQLSTAAAFLAQDGRG